jgi:hypothetical protein
MGQESDKDSKKKRKTHHVRICHDRELHEREEVHLWLSEPPICSHPRCVCHTFTYYYGVTDWWFTAALTFADETTSALGATCACMCSRTSSSGAQARPLLLSHRISQIGPQDFVCSPRWVCHRAGIQVPLPTDHLKISFVRNRLASQPSMSPRPKRCWRGSCPSL